MNKVIKIKFVNKGHVVTTYQWERTFLWFGRWTPVHNHASSSKESCEQCIKKVDILSKYKSGKKLNSENFWD